MTDRLQLLVLEQWHEHARLMAELSLNWFFFACTINAAVAAWMFSHAHFRHSRKVRILMIVCDGALGFGLMFVTPWYYCRAWREIARLTTPDLLTSPLPILEWTISAVAVGAILFVIAWLWCQAPKFLRRRDAKAKK